MQVSHILKTKGSTVTTIAPEVTIAEAVRTLSKKRIGAVLVMGPDEKLQGILSERDIIHGLAEHGIRLLDMRAAELMTKAVVSCKPDNTVDEIMREMTNRRIRHLPVVEGGRLKGIISIGDVVKSRLEELSAESDMLRNYIAGA
ncbi:MAG TPA: CBS domain-containing protein [Alphaproteobacteria bacterium]|nr:CBS domain-containing protein [Alphaproteobacteria bacterium]